MTLFGLSEKDIHKINAVFKQYDAIEEVWIFGSRAKGNYKANSDIDLALKSLNTINLTTLQEIEIKLEELCLPYFFDLINFQLITNVEIKDHINRVGKLFYKKP